MRQGAGWITKQKINLDVATVMHGLSVGMECSCQRGGCPLIHPIQCITRRQYIRLERKTVAWSVGALIEVPCCILASLGFPFYICQSLPGMWFVCGAIAPGRNSGISSKAISHNRIHEYLVIQSRDPVPVVCHKDAQFTKLSCSSEA